MKSSPPNASKLGVSTSVVHAGLQELQTRGFVTIEPRKGTYVSDYRRYGNMNTLIALMKHSGKALSHRTIESFVEVNKMIQILIIEKVIENPDTKDFSPLKNIIRKAEDADTNAEVGDCVIQYWHELCVISGNEILPILLYSFHDLLATISERDCELNGKEEIIEDFKEIYTLTLNGELELCKQEIKQYYDARLYGEKLIYFGDRPDLPESSH